jgi:hypothetical protein
MRQAQPLPDGDQGTEAERYARRAFDHLAHLTQQIGCRGSCTAAEKQAADYAVEQLQAFGVRDLRAEPFCGAASAYDRYALAFGVAVFGILLGLAWTERMADLMAAGLCALGLWGLLAESDFSPNWTRWIIRDRPSQNVVCLLPGHNPGKAVVLTAHIDTHRTPVFNSTRAWQRAYRLAFRASLGCLAAATLISLLPALLGVDWLGWLAIFPAFVLGFGLLAFVQADRTPFSPGAYDNASGVASVLALAERLVEQPLANTAVWIALTGCEETGAAGMAALLQAHRSDWRDAIIVNLDQMGLRRLYVRLYEGLIVRRGPCPAMLDLFREVQGSLPYLDHFERPSQGFSDAAVAYKQGFHALSLGSAPAADGAQIHRHRMSDTVEHIQSAGLRDAHTFVWALLQAVDLNPAPATCGSGP